jgi:hypothetical protein
MAIDASGVNLIGFGYRTKEDIAASTLTTDINDSGKVLNFTHATPVVTLHAAAAGQTLTLRVGANPQLLTLNPNGADAITGCDLNATGNKDVYFTNQPIGSFITLVGTAANTWMVAEVSGVFTKEA